ncbi:LuxR C-terminal-related transcriptional regulator [Amycolatopsis azurea]|uniref:DNA-binding response regulator n=1 Tax=Amycolatopsis azurea DSM 43854 TaxID=1238180 RepID=M2NVL2_9PSEU|nr:response regulator transcription factor [Amycolatopsis azurea]EMD26589.1 regulatory protein, LuxR [Amycolatopsis azurea DSM 43854]OOC05711.1 DNA-binding response regulator [Amycolatopsis azurea DSM 43854]
MNHHASIGNTARIWPAERRDQRRTARLLPDHGGDEKDADPAWVTVLLADSQPTVRYRVRSALETVSGIAVIGEAATANATIAETFRHRPDVLIIDPQLGESAAVDVIGRVSRVAPETRVLVLSAVDDDTAVRSAIQAGARGYLIKGADLDQVIRGVQVVAAGEAIVGKAIARRFSALLRSTLGPEPYPFPQLTTREREVLDRIAAGKSNAAIARDLALAQKTISNRVSAVFGKLGVADRAQAIVLARDAGLGRG